ncbi:MAG: hypothetical protein HQK54_04485 [Oligoflexales bacterium]|nr:hypothetical protein [Oligoflexales bacterium]
MNNLLHSIKFLSVLLFLFFLEGCKNKTSNSVDCTSMGDTLWVVDSNGVASRCNAGNRQVMRCKMGYKIEVTSDKKGVRCKTYDDTYTEDYDRTIEDFDPNPPLYCSYDEEDKFFKFQVNGYYVGYECSRMKLARSRRIVCDINSELVISEDRKGAWCEDQARRILLPRELSADMSFGFCSNQEDQRTGVEPNSGRFVILICNNITKTWEDASRTATSTNCAQMYQGFIIHNFSTKVQGAVECVNNPSMVGRKIICPDNSTPRIGTQGRGAWCVNSDNRIVISTDQSGNKTYGYCIGPLSGEGLDINNTVIKMECPGTYSSTLTTWRPSWDNTRTNLR